MTRRAKRNTPVTKYDRRIIRTERPEDDGDPVPVDEMFSQPVRLRSEKLPGLEDPADLLPNDPFKPYR